ncbi:MAG: 5'-methylthioadenosine/adenosylhomocysteine nucleosidase [Lachnospiraceae bacterium]|nr:5'-methylthioadenosine/adenosylhomocysteine nucleosidase [Lachnospiraceae bacterium]
MIAIIGAMEEELEALLSEMNINKEIKRLGTVFYEGDFFGNDAVVVRSGIGKVNAAACTQFLIDNYSPEVIINTGVAGSLNPDVKIGDLVISESAVHYDVDCTIFGYEKGQVARIPVTYFRSDADWLKLAKTVAESGYCNGFGIHSGVVASGDRFLTDANMKGLIAKEFNALCVEMEGASIAQTAYINATPFLIIRAISDNADVKADKEYADSKEEVIKRGVKLILCMLGKN